VFQTIRYDPEDPVCTKQKPPFPLPPKENERAPKSSAANVTNVALVDMDTSQTVGGSGVPVSSTWDRTSRLPSDMDFTLAAPQGE
jgi:hypothetical protein